MQDISNGFTLPLRIEYRPSRTFFGFNLAVHAGALACTSVAHLPHALATAILCTLVAASAACEWRRYRAQRNALHPVWLHLNARDAWWLIEAGADAQRLRLLAGAFVHPRLIVLRFSTAGSGRRTFLLCADNADPDTLRRLRVRLRFSGRVAAMMADEGS